MRVCGLVQVTGLGFAAFGLGFRVFRVECVQSWGRVYYMKMMIYIARSVGSKDFQMRAWCPGFKAWGSGSMIDSRAHPKALNQRENSFIACKRPDHKPNPTSSDPAGLPGDFKADQSKHELPTPHAQLRNNSPWVNFSEVEYYPWAPRLVLHVPKKVICLMRGEALQLRNEARMQLGAAQ